MFSNLVIAYLFLGGTGAGVHFLACVLGLLSPANAFTGRNTRGIRVVDASFAYCKLFASLHIAAAAIMIIGLLCLFFDLGRPERVLAMLAGGTATIANVGAVALALCIALSVLGVFAWVDNCERVPVIFMRTVQSLGLLVAFVVMTYTGLLLGSMDSVILWRGPFLLALFTASSASCGCAVALLLSHIMRMRAVFASTWRLVVRSDVVLLAVEALLLAAYVCCGVLDVFGNGSADAFTALVSGSEALLFWVVFVCLGLAVPLGLELCLLLKRLPCAAVPYISIAACACILIGGAMLRYLVVTVAEHPYLGSLPVLSSVGLS